MSDQQPGYSPPPVTPPPPAYSADTLGVPTSDDPGAQVTPPAPPMQSAPPAPPKKKTALIIGIVVAVLALCCCIAAGVAGLVAFRSETSTSTSEDITSGPAEDVTSDDPTDYDNDRVQEWLAWAPSMSAEDLPSIPAEKEPLVVEALGIAAPEFEFDSAAWWQGGYDADEDWYYPDYYYIRAYHPASDDISAALEILIEGDEMAAIDIDYSPADGNLTDSIDGGSRTIEWSPMWGTEGFNLADEDEIELWKTVGRDWPDAVALGLYESKYGEGYADVDITTWDIYTYDVAVPYVTVTYELGDGEWILYEWEYIYPEDEGGSV